MKPPSVSSPITEVKSQQDNRQTQALAPSAYTGSGRDHTQTQHASQATTALYKAVTFTQAAPCTQDPKTEPSSPRRPNSRMTLRPIEDETGALAATSGRIGDTPHVVRVLVEVPVATGHAATELE